MAELFKELSREQTGDWGAGYFAEGARGSRGPRADQVGDRAKVEASLKAAFASRNEQTVSVAGLEKVVKGKGTRMTKHEEQEDVN